MSTPAARSRMKKIMQLISPLPAEESYPETAFHENIQQDTESLVLDSNLPTYNNHDIDMESILTGTTSPSLVDFICDTDLNSGQNTNPRMTSPLTKLLEYSDSDTDNSYTLLDLDYQNEIAHVDVTKNYQTNLEDPAMPITFNQLIQPSTTSLIDQQEQNVSRKSESHDDNAYIDSEDSWKPATSSSDSDEDEPAQQIEEEASVGKRGYRKTKPLPKRLLLKENRRAAVGKSVQPNPCMNKRCGNLCASKFTEDDRTFIFENYWGLGCDKRQKDFLLSCAKEKPIGRKRACSNIRKTSFDYFISYNGQSIKVCQQFLLKTLNISQMSLRYTIENANKILNTTKEGRRTRHPHKKSSEIEVAHVKSFIEMLPAVPSHYCRNKSTKVYLPQEFQNISFLYTLYVVSSHFVRFDKARILVREKRFIQRKVHEAIEIGRRSNFNRDGGWTVAPAWRPVLPTIKKTRSDNLMDTISQVCLIPMPPGINSGDVVTDRPLTAVDEVIEQAPAPILTAQRALRRARPQ